MAARWIVAAVCYLACSGALAQSIDVQLAPDNLSLSLQLPPAAFERGDSQLSVDIDGYDVTGFSRIENQRLFINLEVPLAAGQRALSVFAFHADGSADILVDVALNVPEADPGTWSLNTMFQTNYRTADRPDVAYDGVDAMTNAGSITFEASDAAGHWGTGASLKAMYDEGLASTPGAEEWLLPFYEAYAGYGGDTSSAWLVAGNIGVDREDLLFSKYQRRGAALESSLASNRFSLKAFSVSSRPRNAFDGDYVQPSDSNDETRGVSTRLVIVERRLELGGGFVDGKSSFGGEGFNLQDDPLIFGGDSWNLSLDSRWLDKSLWLHVERASSDFDADGFGTGLPSVEDDATQAMLQLSSAGKLGSGPFAYWNAVLSYRKVGRDFYTLGNLSLPGNLEAGRAWFQGGFTSVVVELEVAEEQTNPDDNPAFASQTLDRAGINVAWTPASLQADAAPWRVLGLPSLAAWAYRVDNSQPDDDALLAGFDVDSRTDDAGIAITFAGDVLNWSIEYGAVDYEDNSTTVIDNGFIIYEPYSDSRNRYLSVATSWAIGERVVLEAFLQKNRLEETDFADEYESTNYGVSGNVILVPNELSLFASASRGRDRNQFGDPQFLPESFESTLANLQLNWQVAAAEGAKPAVNLFLKGNYGRNENPGLQLDDELWAIYIGASLNWTGSK